MVRKLAWLPLALLLAVLAPTPAHAEVGMPLMRGLADPGELADLIEASLKEDSSGNGRLDAENCTKQKASRCATANDYFEGIKGAHASVKLDKVEELAPYLRSLVRRPGPEGKWHMSRLLVATNGEEVSTRYDNVGWARSFHKGEDAWYDGTADEPILAGDCGNVVGAPIAPPKPKPVRRHKPRQHFVREVTPAAPMAPAPASYPSSHPEFGTFPTAVCTSPRTQCRKQGGF